MLRLSLLKLGLAPLAQNTDRASFRTPDHLPCLPAGHGLIRPYLNRLKGRFTSAISSRWLVGVSAVTECNPLSIKAGEFLVALLPQSYTSVIAATLSATD